MLLGSAMLITHDMDTRMEWSPWLAGVFVAPDYHRKGIGIQLVRRIVQDASALGVRRLYLYTPSVEQFNSRHGWSVVERTNYRGADVVVMSYDCAAQRLPSVMFYIGLDLIYICRNGG
jgi:N-acetylglutamate synthase-like GNAT family acetyltransferase